MAPTSLCLCLVLLVGLFVADAKSSRTTSESEATTTTLAATTSIVYSVDAGGGVSAKQQMVEPGKNASAAPHVMIRGIHVHKFLPERKLHLNGAGIRSFSMFGSSWLSAEIYLASFYTQSGTLDSFETVHAAVMDRSETMQFNFTFLRSISDPSQVYKAWQRQLDHSVDQRYSLYDQYPEHVETFCRMFGPITDRGATETVILHKDETLVMDQGKFKGKIVGKQFQRAFVSMWFGNQAVAPDLKDGLLGLLGSKYHEQQVVG